MKKQKKIEECKATHEEVCNQALEQYEEMSRETGQWNSVIPKAIEFYKRFYEIQPKNPSKPMKKEKKIKEEN